MEDVLGRRSDPDQFAAFLADWEATLARRVEEATAALAGVAGVRGIILAGGVGRGAPWPLSDIDLLPIYDERMESARVAVETCRLTLLDRWAEEGWWTGLDIGRLAFRTEEVAAVLRSAPAETTAVLSDDRWYHALDKGYGARAVYDPDGLAAPLAGWCSDRRFEPAVVRFRLRRERAEVEAAARRAAALAKDDDLLGATGDLREAVKWTRIWLLERRGERDNSLGRIGTRFERLAVARGDVDVVRVLHELSHLGDDAVAARMAAAPDWVKERHDRSCRARRQVGEDVSPLQDARDTLRVCAHYAARRIAGPPYPSWLAIESDPGRVADAAGRLLALVESLEFLSS
jgi:hypothetical protein